VLVRARLYTHIIDSTAAAMCCFNESCLYAETHSHSFLLFCSHIHKGAGGKSRVSSLLPLGACACGPANNCPWCERAESKYVFSTRTRVYTCLHPYPAYTYLSLCYITIQSHTYVILNMYIYTLTYAPKIFVVQSNRCDFSRTYSFG